MPFADTSNSSLAYVQESTFDTAPTTGWKLLRNTGESLNTSLESAQSEEIDSTAQFTGSVHVSGKSAGGVNFQLSYAEYDDFLAAVMRSANWTAGYSDIITAVATRVCTVTSTTGLKVGHILKFTGAVPSSDDGVYTVEAVLSGTTFRVAEAITDDSPATITVVNSGAIENGTTSRSFSFEKKFDVNGTANYFLMSGMKAGSMSLSTSAGSIINGTFNFEGATGTSSATSKEASAYTAATTNELMNSVSNVTGLGLYSIATDGTATAIAATFQEFSLSVDSSLRAQNAVGSLFPQGIGEGRVKVEATASLYFSNRDLFTQFLANGSVQLRFQMTDAADAYGNRYGVVLPELKISSHEVTASGPDSDIMASVTFSGQKDARSGTGKSILVSKIAAA